ncbi:hypothetical protein ACE2AJ_00485 [Aquihabitans daechungensis]|uniref:hypothetical protein n=1 Tax=Aquihabitans daechungensis TaxID=1052257 RepID=UPI003BA1A874
MRDQSGFLPFTIESEVPPSELDGIDLQWLAVKVDKTLVIKPVESDGLRRCRQRWHERQLLGLAPIPPGSRITIVSARPAGESVLENLPLPVAVKKIGELVRSKSDTRNVVELLCGYRVSALRRPLQSAYGAVGWPRLKVIMEARPDGWPDDLRDLVFAEVEAHRKRVAEAPSLSGPSFGPDYALDDW